MKIKSIVINKLVNIKTNSLVVFKLLLLVNIYTKLIAISLSISINLLLISFYSLLSVS